jgi:hypothetical protein
MWAGKGSGWLERNRTRMFFSTAVLWIFKENCWKMVINTSISAGSRFQFSVEKAYT